MVTLATVEQQLKAVGCAFRFWGRAEMRELCQVLLPGEQIAGAVNGQYDAGFAMLVATDMRILLIDKKPKYLTLKDIRYDMITELDFSGRMLNSTIRIYTPNKELRFTTPSAKRLRKLFTYTQHKVMEIRHRFMMQQFQHQHELQNTPPGVAMMQNYYQNQFDQYPQPAAVEANASHSLDEKGSVKAADFEGNKQQNSQFYELANLYNPEPAEKQSRIRAAMGHAGLRSIVHNGQIIREYMSVPFAQRWRKRPYGFSRDKLTSRANEQISRI